MRSLVVVSLAVLVLVCGASANANARGWRDLRIDASSTSRFDDSIQQMRDELPYNRAVLFVLVLQDLKARLTPDEYRKQLDGLAYKDIARLASPAVTDRYVAYYFKSRGTDNGLRGSLENEASGFLPPLSAPPEYAGRR